MSKYTYSTANLTDTELKEQGNRLFEQRKYDDAVSCYTKAIVCIYLTFETFDLFFSYIFLYSLCPSVECTYLLVTSKFTHLLKQF